MVSFTRGMVNVGLNRWRPGPGEGLLERAFIFYTSRHLCALANHAPQISQIVSLDRGMPELTGEAVILRHTDLFDPEVVAAARTRLVAAGVDVDQLPAR
jgi:hypothetical protein